MYEGGGLGANEIWEEVRGKIERRRASKMPKDLNK